MDKNLKNFAVNESALYIGEPLYYKDFSCIGAECPLNCCYGWEILWRNDEVQKLKEADCSDDLKKIIAEAFEPHNDLYMIKFKNNKCPLLTEDNMCRIQRELGVEFMSRTCMEYPRKLVKCGNIGVKSCFCSCCHVMKIICNDPNAMKLENKRRNAEKYPKLSDMDTKIQILNQPQLKYRRELFDFFWGILSEESHSIETSIVLASLAARNIDKFIDKRQYDRIPEIIKALKPQLNDPLQIEKLENAKSNLSLKMNFASALIHVLKATTAYKFVENENGIPDEQLCSDGVKKFDEMFKDRPYAMRNIALNLFITMFMPYRDRTASLFQNFCYYAAEISAIKFIGAVMAAKIVEEDAEESFYYTAAHIDRSFTHSEVNLQKIYDMLETFGINSPAYLMGILK